MTRLLLFADVDLPPTHLHQPIDCLVDAQRLLEIWDFAAQWRQDCGGVR